MKNKVQRAISFAVWKHRNQLRKGTTLPYIVHPLKVMLWLISWEQPEDIIVAGLLHDTLEDTNTSYWELRLKFGKRVADIVKGCSENKKLSWKERKQETIDKIARCPDKDVVMVELADKISNLWDIYTDCDKPNFWKRFKVGKKSLKWYYGELYKVIKIRCQNQAFKEEFGRLYKEVF